MLSIRIEEAGYRDRPVLRGLSLRVDGEKILVAGASGSGKTTLFLAVTGVLSHLWRVRWIYRAITPWRRGWRGWLRG